MSTTLYHEDAATPLLHEYDAGLSPMQSMHPVVEDEEGQDYEDEPQYPPAPAPHHAPLETSYNVLQYPKEVLYLRNYKFKPHILGNSMLYGLNSFGCDSTISYKDDIWRFIYFSGNGACYTNAQNQCITIPLEYNDEITRMQICPPDQLDPALENYLIDLEAYRTFSVETEGQEVDGETVQLPPKPVRTKEIEELIACTGFKERELLSVLEFCEPDIDGIGEARGGGYYFDLEKLY
jgi:hypothetical protein